MGRTKTKIPIEDEYELEEKWYSVRPQKRRKEVIQTEDLRAGWKKKLEKRGNLEKYARAIGVGLTYPKNRKKRLPKNELLEKILDRAIHKKRSLHQNWITRVDNKQSIY